MATPALHAIRQTFPGIFLGGLVRPGIDQLLAGTTFFDGRTRTVLVYDPVTETVSASVNDVELGSFYLPIDTPKFIGIEGVGIVDNFVVRELP